MRPQTKRALSLMVSAALLIAAAVVHVSLIRPVYEEILNLRGELKARNQFLKEQTSALAKVSDLILQYQGSEQIQNTISLSYPLDEGLASVFNQLRTLAQVNGLGIEIFNVKPLALRELVAAPLIRNSGTLQVSMRVTGSYPAFKRFVQGVETNIRAMDVQSFSVERSLAPNIDFFVYNLTVNSYYQGD